MKGNKKNLNNNLLLNETIEVQNKRKIILNGLIYNENETEQEREENIKKLEELIKYDHNKDNNNNKDNNQIIQFQNKQKNLNKRNHNSYDRNNKPAFIPKWNDYDVMRHRWSYIQPQTKRLMPENNLSIPTTPNSSTILVPSEDNTEIAVNGSYLDAEYFIRLKSPGK